MGNKELLPLELGRELNEEWRTIAAHPSYEVSNLGQVRSWKNNRWGKAKTPRILKQSPNRDGYLQVMLDRKPRRVHNLVLTTFIGPRPDGQQGAHGNGDKTDNRLANLRWATRQENDADNVRHGSKAGERNPNSRFTEAEVLDMRLERHYLGYSLGRIARRHGTSTATVSKIVNYKRWANVA